MTDGDFIAYLNNVVMPEQKKHLEFYAKDVKFKSRQFYQASKVIEEIGELLQAVSAENFAKRIEDNQYSHLRGTVESESADVVIACVGFYVTDGKEIPNLALGVRADNDELVLFHNLMMHASEFSFRKVLLTVKHWMDDKGLDIYEHVVLRVKFNREQLISRGAKL